MSQPKSNLYNVFVKAFNAEQELCRESGMSFQEFGEEAHAALASLMGGLICSTAKKEEHDIHIDFATSNIRRAVTSFRPLIVIDGGRADERGSQGSKSPGASAAPAEPPRGVSGEN